MSLNTLRVLRRPVESAAKSGCSSKILPGDQSLIVGYERLLRFSRLLVELEVGLSVCSERERFPVEEQDAPQVVGEWIAQFLECGSLLHVISPSSLLS